MQSTLLKYLHKLNTNPELYRYLHKNYLLSRSVYLTTYHAYAKPDYVVHENNHFVRLQHISYLKLPYLHYTLFNHVRFCSAKPSSTPQPPLPHPKLLQKLSKLENSMRYHGYSVLRIGAAIMILSGVAVYLFREFIRENVAVEVSGVAQRSLSNDAVKQSAEEMAKALINTVLSDQSLKNQAVIFLQDVFSRQETKDVTAVLLVKILKDSTVQQQMITSLKNLLIKSLNDVSFRKNLSYHIHVLLQDEGIRQSLLQLLKFILADETLKETAGEFVVKLLNMEVVRETAIKLGQDTLSGVVQDANVRKQTGDALWAAVSYSFRPRWFRKSTKQEEIDSIKEDHEDMNDIDTEDENVDDANDCMDP